MSPSNARARLIFSRDLKVTVRACQAVFTGESTSAKWVRIEYGWIHPAQRSSCKSASVLISTASEWAASSKA